MSEIRIVFYATGRNRLMSVESAGPFQNEFSAEQWTRERKLSAVVVDRIVRKGADR